MVKQHIYSSYNLDDIERLVAYVNHQPVGIVDIIMTDKTIEIDGFGVLEEFQHQGIGSEIQATLDVWLMSDLLFLLQMEKILLKICI